MMGDWHEGSIGRGGGGSVGVLVVTRKAKLSIFLGNISWEETSLFNGLEGVPF